MKLDILAIGAHPDDVELGCGGTLAKEVANGKKVGVLDLTRGELGSNGSADLRDVEAANAAKIMGIHVRENLAFRDGFFINDESHQLRIIEVIRKYQPEIVLCNAISDRHIDHSKGSKLASDACFLSGLVRIKTKHNGVEQDKWRPKQVYHYIQWESLKPDIVVDITGFNEVKVAAVKAYGSQFYNPKDASSAKTPISNQNFLDSVTYRGRDFGRIIGTDHAEGYTVERYPAVKSIFDLI